MTTNEVSTWIDRYVHAWNSNDPAEIRALFAEDAAYYPGPFDQPWRSHAAIISNWLDRQDEPGSTTFRYDVLASTPEHSIIRGWTHYDEPPRDYSNIWLIRFDQHGRCREFTEWWMERPTA